MAFTKYTKDTTIIGALGTNPAERALTTQEFKDKFDQFADEFVAWFNATHVVEADAHLAETATEEGGVHGIEIERGTFTPVLVGTITQGAPAYVFQCGTYYKVGKLISCNILLQISDKGGMDGLVIIDGLPFIAGGSLGNAFNRYSASIADYSDVTPSVIGAWLASGSAGLRLAEMTSNDIARELNASGIGASFEIQISIVYETI